MTAFRIGQRGNIAAIMFATVGMVAVAGGAALDFVLGPITTATKVTSRNMAETDLMTNARLVVMNAATIVSPEGYAPGDEDGDGYIEPVPFVPTSDPACSIILPGEGGCLPASLGASLTDPWGTPYGYCVWDHGDPNISDNRIQGGESTSAAVIALISAGANKRFETPCLPFDIGDPTRALINPDGEGDDFVRTYTYDAAVAGAGGLWELKADDGQTAVIDKKLEIGDVAGGTGFAFDTGTGTGEFPYIKTDFIASRSGSGTPVEFMDNIALNGKWLSGDGDSEGIYIGSSGNVGIGTSEFRANFDVTGDIQSKRDSSTGILGTLHLEGENSTSARPNKVRWTIFNMNEYNKVPSELTGLSIYEYYDADGDGLFCDDSGACQPRLTIASGGGVAIGTPMPDTSAKLEVASTTQGFLPPRMTTAQRDAIDNPAMGLMVFNVTEKAPEFFDGTEWLSMLGGGGGAACAAPWGVVVNHGETVVAYQAATVPYGSTCSAETRLCSNGQLSGQFEFDSCVVEPPENCTLPWGGTINHGDSITAYQTSSVACGESCESQIRTCNNGTLSGTYSKESCTAQSCQCSGMTYRPSEGAPCQPAPSSCNTASECRKTVETNLPNGAFVMNHMHDSGSDCGNDYPIHGGYGCKGLTSPTNSSNSYWKACGGDKCASGRIQCVTTTTSGCPIATGYCYCVP